MGLKRKASDLEDAFCQPEATTSPIAPSLSSSPGSTSTLPSSLAGHASPYTFYKISPVPYLGSRTRKRYRDDRPDEETIHENTLRKLYDAQRLHLDEAVPLSEAMSIDDHDERLEYKIDMIDEPETMIPNSIQRNQRTLEAFFGKKPTTQSKPSGSRWPVVDGTLQPFTESHSQLQKQYYGCCSRLDAGLSHTGDPFNTLYGTSSGKWLRKEDMRDL